MIEANPAGWAMIVLAWLAAGIVYVRSLVRGAVDRESRAYDTVECSCGAERYTWEQCPECGTYGGRST